MLRHRGPLALAFVSALLVGWSALLACVGDDPQPGGNTTSSSGASSGGSSGTGSSSGAAGPAQLKLDPVTYRFPVTKPGATSAVAQFVVKNIGGAAAPPLQRAGLQGANTTPFAIKSDACEGKALEPNASCIVELTFAPSAIGEAMATLLVGTLPAAITGFGGNWLPEDAKGASLNSVWAQTTLPDGGADSTFYAVGNGGKILVSQGNGTWTEETGTAGGDLFSVYGTRANDADTSAGVVLAAGNGPRLLRKKKSATSWEDVSLATQPPTGLTSGRAVWATSENQLPFTAYYFGQAASNGHYFSFPADSSPNFKTIPGDGGATSMNAVNAMRGYTDPGDNDYLCAVGAMGMVYSIPSFSPSGTAVQIAGAPTLRGLFIDRPGAFTVRVLVVGDGGGIYRGGGCSAATTAEPSNVSAQLNAVFAIGPDEWAVGNGGTILHKQSGGSWTKEESGTTQDLRGVFALSANDIIVVGDKIILHKK